MPNLIRIRAAWSGFTGGPGINTWYTPDPLDAPGVLAVRDALKAFYTPLNQYLPATVSVTIETSGDKIDQATGVLVGEWAEATPKVVTSQVNGSFVGGTGCFVRARTTEVFQGKRVKGGLYLCPLNGNAYDADGHVAPGVVTAINAAGVTLIGSGHTFFISAAARPATTTRPASAYHAAQITTLTARPAASQLRSRRG